MASLRGSPTRGEGTHTDLIALRGGAILPGYYFRNDEFIPLELARWFEATTLAEVEAQYWMLRRECDPIPELPL